MKKYAIVVDTEDSSFIEIFNGSRDEGMKTFKQRIFNCINTQSTVCVGFVELEDDGTGKIDIDYEITGPGESLTFLVEPNFWDEDKESFDNFFLNWLSN